MCECIIRKIPSAMEGDFMIFKVCPDYGCIVV